MTEHSSKTVEKALRLRARVKHRKPKFVRPESWRYVRLKENWRRPRGLDNKVRRKIKGWPPSPEAGYRGPKVARNLHPSGYREVLVYNIEDLTKVDPKTQAIRIAHTVSKRKRAGILVEARRRKTVILNLKEAKQAKEAALEEKEEEEIEEKEVKEQEAVKAEEKKEAEKETEAKEEEKPKRKRRKAKTKGEAEKE